MSETKKKTGSIFDRRIRPNMPSKEANLEVKLLGGLNEGWDEAGNRYFICMVDDNDQLPIPKNKEAAFKGKPKKLIFPQYNWAKDYIDAGREVEEVEGEEPSIYFKIPTVPLDKNNVFWIRNPLIEETPKKETKKKKKKEEESD